MSNVIDVSAGDFVHLGLGATTVPLPTHTGDMEWYAEYGRAHGDDGAEGRLVSMHTFTESWDTWEMHPVGSELVLCVAGSVSLTQEQPDGTVGSVTISAGQAVVNAPGVWHTADIVDGPTTVVFITAGEGTQMPRSLNDPSGPGTNATLTQTGTIVMDWLAVASSWP